MRIIFWGNGNRGVTCLRALIEQGYDIDLVVAHPGKQKQSYPAVSELAMKQGIRVIQPEDPNGEDSEQVLNSYPGDIYVLAGYGKILKQNILSKPHLMSINLHAGKLPQYRGSSPLNWALINGETSFTLSIIRLDTGVDTGDIIMEKTYQISENDTIRDLHRIAGDEYPLMLLETLNSIRDGSHNLRPQDNSNASYYPLRFPDDGLILWDIYTAEEVHNQIRALTTPYPCAFTFFEGRKVKLLLSELNNHNYFGEPGRIYIKNNNGLLICALDRCLWIREAVFDDNGEPLSDVIKRYDKMATVRGAATQYAFHYHHKEGSKRGDDNTITGI
jgi:methionyl-tRNA formyltransferase